MAVIDTVYSPSGQAISIVDQKEVGFNALDAEAFMKLLIAQLQNQDPTEPMSNEQLLGQISEMRSLQASVELESSIQKLAGSQNSAATASFASSAAALIGHIVVGQTEPSETEDGTTIPSQPVAGMVDRAVLRDGKAYVGIGDYLISVENILSVE